MPKATKRFRRGLAVTYLKRQRRKINSNPTIILYSSGRKGRIRKRTVVEDKYIERRLRELLDLMKHQKESGIRSAKEIFSHGVPVRTSEIVGLANTFQEYKKEFIELSQRLDEIKRARNDMRQNARIRARKIAGKKPNYIDTTVILEADLNQRRLKK